MGWRSVAVKEVRPMPESCPTANDLAAFAAGDLPRAVLDRIARHAVECERCGLGAGRPG